MRVTVFGSAFLLLQCSLLLEGASAAAVLRRRHEQERKRRRRLQSSGRRLSLSTTVHLTELLHLGLTKCLMEETYDGSDPRLRYCLPHSQPTDCTDKDWEIVSVMQDWLKCTEGAFALDVKPVGNNGWLALSSKMHDAAVTDAAAHAIEHLLEIKKDHDEEQQQEQQAAIVAYSFQKSLEDHAEQHDLDFVVVRGSYKHIGGGSGGMLYRLLVLLSSKEHSDCIGSFSVEIQQVNNKDIDSNNIIIQRYGKEVSCQAADDMDEYFVSAPIVSKQSS